MTPEFRAAVWIKQRAETGQRPLALTLGGKPRSFLAEGALIAVRHASPAAVVVRDGTAKEALERDLLQRLQLRIEQSWSQRIKDADIVIMSGEEFSVRVPEILREVSALILADPAVVSPRDRFGLARASSWSEAPLPWIAGFSAGATEDLVGPDRLFTVAGSVVAGMSISGGVAVESIS
jgi:hypothetical protein